MSFPDFTIHGAKVFQIKPDKLIRDAAGIDRVTCFWQTDRGDSFIEGHPPPGHPHMRIVEVETNPEIIGHAYEHVLQAEGIAGVVPYKILPIKPHQTDEGWDEMEVPVITREPDDPMWLIGAQIEGYPHMWINDRTPAQHRARGYYDMMLRMKGLLPAVGGISKPVKRRGGTSTFSWSGDKIEYAQIQQGVFGWPPQPGGLYSAPFGQANWQVDQPGQSVTDILITTSPPPTWLVPGFWVPPNAPPIGIVPFVYSENPTYYWPFGWQCSNMQYERLLDKNIWLIAITWNTKPQSTPNGASTTVVRL